MPILQNVLIEAEDGKVSLTTTNLDLGARCSIKAEVSESGTVTLPVKELGNIVRQLADMEVSVETGTEPKAKITTRGSVFNVMGMESAEFPPLPTLEGQREFDLERTELVQMLKNVSYAQSVNEERYMLKGVYFFLEEEELSLVATDGRRLALTSRGLKTKNGEGGEFFSSYELEIQINKPPADDLVYLWGGMTIFWLSIGLYVLYISNKFRELSEKIGVENNGAREKN